RPHAARAAGEPAVVGDAGLRDRTPGAYGPQRESLPELILRRSRRVQVFAWDHALGQVVEPLEAVATRDDDVARGEQVLERALRGLPVPHLARHRTLALEGA